MKYTKSQRHKNKAFVIFVVVLLNGSPETHFPFIRSQMLVYKLQGCFL